MKKTVRWMPTTPLGVPHESTKNDYYAGHLILKNAGVIINVWGIHMDPQRHPNPRTFDPDRYKGDDLSYEGSAKIPDYRKRDNIKFGAGRCICPGIYVAEVMIFLSVSRLMWGLNIEPALDQDGKPILPNPDKLTQGTLCKPEEYLAKITTRSQTHEDVMVSEWRKAEQDCLDPETKQWRKTPM